tara:strand:+ start:3475 stop:4302 length:828 start_codon:yes stop_codon:yes gene_type:complete
LLVALNGVRFANAQGGSRPDMATVDVLFDYSSEKFHMTMNATLYYIYDPMCSWCWGYRPVWDALKLNLSDAIQIEYVAGGLAPDSNKPMPVEQQAMVKAHWHSIEEKLGTKFNFDFWRNNTPRRSTYNACRAAIAANNQGYQVEMVEAIQHAYYLRALNPSDNDVLIGLAKELSTQKLSTQKLPTQKLAEQKPSKQESIAKSAFDLTRFTADFTSEENEQALMQQIHLARALTNQGFPSLVLECNGVRRQILLNYKDYQATLADINKVLDKCGSS